MSVGLLMGQTIEPTIATDGTVAATPADTDELGRLADTLAAIDAVPIALGMADTVPRRVFVEPSTLQAVTNDDPALAGAADPRPDGEQPRRGAALAVRAIGGRRRRPGRSLHHDCSAKAKTCLAQLLPRTDVVAHPARGARAVLPARCRTAAQDSARG